MQPVSRTRPWACISMTIALLALAACGSPSPTPDNQGAARAAGGRTGFGQVGKHRGLVGAVLLPQGDEVVHAGGGRQAGTAAAGLTKAGGARLPADSVSTS